MCGATLGTLQSTCQLHPGPLRQCRAIIQKRLQPLNVHLVWIATNSTFITSANNLSTPRKPIIDNKNKVKGPGVHVKEFARPWIGDSQYILCERGLAVMHDKGYSVNEFLWRWTIMYFSVDSVFDNPLKFVSTSPQTLTHYCTNTLLDNLIFVGSTPSRKPASFCANTISKAHSLLCRNRLGQLTPFNKSDSPLYPAWLTAILTDYGAG